MGKEEKSRLLEQTFPGSLFQWLKSVWPQVPLGLFLIFTGIANILIGLQSYGFNSVYQILAQMIPLSELNQEMSLGILGSSMQVLLGIGMLVSGIGLFWRLRSAWAYTILFVMITIAVDLFSQRPFRDLLMPVLALAALIIWQSRFDHRSLIGSYLMSIIGLLSVLAYGVFGSLLLGNNFKPGIHDLYTALYFTVVTLSTVGSNIYPATPVAQVFMVTLIIGGISIFTTTIVITLGPLLSNQIRPILSRKKIEAESNAHVLLIGTSSFAKRLAIELSNQKIDFVQVVTLEGTPSLTEQPIVRVDTSDEVLLKQVGIISAKTVVIAGEDDAANASAALIVKKLNRKARLVVVAGSSQGISQLKLTQADLIFPPTAVGARLLTNLIMGAPIPRELEDLFENSKKDEIP